MHRKDFHILVSPGFLIGLSVLLLNDFLLKQQFHNSLTGKLSDFAGLFVFSLFCAAFVTRYRVLTYLLIATLFVFWKSEYSQSLIEGWNSLQLFRIARTVDYSDLIALVTLPLSYACSSTKTYVDVPRKALCGIAIIAIFAFTATSFSAETKYDNQYRFQESKAELIKKIKNLKTKQEIPLGLRESDSDKFKVSFDNCIAAAYFEVSEENGRGIIKLNKIHFRCPTGNDKEELRIYFEKEFIETLKDSQTNEPDQINYIVPELPSDN